MKKSTVLHKFWGLVEKELEASLAVLVVLGAIFGYSLAGTELVTGDIQIASTTGSFVINGKTYVAVATDSGVSVINETDETVIDYVLNNTDDVNDVFLTSGGDLYYALESGQDVLAFHNIQNDATDAATSTIDIIYNESSQPAIFTSAQTINDLFVVEDSSFLNNSTIQQYNNTVFIAHNAGLTKLSENSASSTLSSIKYYQTATTTEEMIGDIRGMWPFNDALANMNLLGRDKSFGNGKISKFSI